MHACAHTHTHTELLLQILLFILLIVFIVFTSRLIHLAKLLYSSFLPNLVLYFSFSVVSAGIEEDKSGTVRSSLESGCQGNAKASC